MVGGKGEGMGRGKGEKRRREGKVEDNWKWGKESRRGREERGREGE